MTINTGMHFLHGFPYIHVQFRPPLKVTNWSLWALRDLFCLTYLLKQCVCAICNNETFSSRHIILYLGKNKMLYISDQSPQTDYFLCSAFRLGLRVQNREMEASLAVAAETAATAAVAELMHAAADKITESGGITRLDFNLGACTGGGSSGLFYWLLASLSSPPSHNYRRQQPVNAD